MAGLILAVLGAIWTLQGVDLLGQEGGMNGRREWTVIGAVAVVGGLLLTAIAMRTRSQS